jgi:hypothetical protein
MTVERSSFNPPAKIIGKAPYHKPECAYLHSDVSIGSTVLTCLCQASFFHLMTLPEFFAAALMDRFYESSLVEL